MIIVRAPLRISLGGGGTDLPSFYKLHGSSFVSASIDKYVYISVSRPFDEIYRLKYSECEAAASIDEIRHPIIREVISRYGKDLGNLEISTFSDVPAGTGLGSSGAFTTGLIFALRAFRENVEHVDKLELALEAIDIEMNLLKNGSGMQDQLIAALGGVRDFSISLRGSIRQEQIIPDATLTQVLETNLQLFYTGVNRRAADLLHDQAAKTSSGDDSTIGSLLATKAIGERSSKSLREGKFTDLGPLLNEQWEQKMLRQAGSLSPGILRMRNIALREGGASGAKLVGAGGGGFLLTYSEQADKTALVMRNHGFRELPFKFDENGVERLV